MSSEPDLLMKLMITLSVAVSFDFDMINYKAMKCEDIVGRRNSVGKIRISRTLIPISREYGMIAMMY